MNPLVQQALVGTAKAPGSALPDHPAAGLVALRNDLGTETRLLLAAGAVALADRAGIMPASAPSLPEPAADETCGVCSPAAAAIVADLVSRRLSDQAILIEAFELIHAAGQVLPPALLAPALDLPNRRELRAALRGALGERGRWMAQFNEAWHWARHFVDDAQHAERLPTDAETIWQEGDLAARVELLKLARRHDRPKSREWLAGVWNVEKADARGQLLEAFAMELSADDLPSLEPILKDRSAALRRQAAQALARIDQSPLAERMKARADGLIQICSAKPAGFGAKLKSLLGGPAVRLEITLPDELAKDWLADGIEAKPPHGVGERAFRLIQIVSLVSPRHWQTRSGLAPADFLAVAANAEHGDTLIEGLTTAALALGSTDWLAALWDQLLAADAMANQQRLARNRIAWLQAVLAALPPAEAEPRLAQLLGSSANWETLNLSAVLEVLPRPWSESFAGQYLRWFWKVASRAQSGDLHNWSTGMAIAAVAIPQASFGEALRERPRVLEQETHQFWLKQCEGFQDVVRLRQRLCDALGQTR
jgi:hypothetical protein